MLLLLLLLLGVAGRSEDHVPSDALESGRAVVGWESEVRCAAGGVRWLEAAEREPLGPVLIGGGPRGVRAVHKRHPAAGTGRSE